MAQYAATQLLDGGGGGSLKYKTTTTATVWEWNSSSSSMNARGTLSPGNIVEVVSTKYYNGNTYCCVSSSTSVKYYPYASSYATASMAGMYILQSQASLYNPSAGTTVQVQDKSGVTHTISGITEYPAGSRTTYYVQTGYMFWTYKGPNSSQYDIAKTYEAGKSITVYATYLSDNGYLWATVDSSYSTWGIISHNGGSTIVDALKTTKSSNTSPGNVDQDVFYEDPTYVQTDSDGNPTDVDMTVFATEEEELDWAATIDSIREVNTDSLKGLHNMQYVIGIPPKITPTADIQYMTTASPSNDFGRCYTEMFMQGATVLSMQPCKVKYLPSFTDDMRTQFAQKVISTFNGSGGDSATGSEISGQLFEGQCDYGEYINTVNMLARTFAVYLGIGNKTYMNTNTKYSAMDYSFYKIKEPTTKAEDIDPDSSALKKVFSAIKTTAQRAYDALVTSAINDDTYLHFYLTGDGSTANESFTVTTKSSALESLFNDNLSAIAQEIQFLGGGEAGEMVASFVEDLSDGITSFGTVGNTLASLMKHGANYIRGARMIFPQILDDCVYDRSYKATCRFVSASGDPEAIFLNCYLPLCYLLPYVLPQQLSDSMYRYPFLARVNCKGWYHCDLAAVTGLQIQRGGPDSNCFTEDGLPFEIDVSFDITPLYSRLMVTSARHPILFLSNSALHEYIGAMCGVSFTGNQWEIKGEMLKALAGDYIKDTIPSMLRGYYSSNVASWLGKLMNL